MRGVWTNPAITSQMTGQNAIPYSPTRYCAASRRDTFTGQYSYITPFEGVDDLSTEDVVEGFGLMDYDARMYDPQLGRFAQADSIIPSAQGVQAWDRYAYTNNSPVNFTDPTGHCALCVVLVLTSFMLTGSVPVPETHYAEIPQINGVKSSTMIDCSYSNGTCSQTTNYLINTKAQIELGEVILDQELVSKPEDVLIDDLIGEVVEKRIPGYSLIKSQVDNYETSETIEEFRDNYLSVVIPDAMKNTDPSMRVSVTTFDPFSNNGDYTANSLVTLEKGDQSSAFWSPGSGIKKWLDEHTLFLEGLDFSCFNPSALEYSCK